MKNNKIQNRGKQALALSMLMMSLSILSPNVASKNIDSFMKLGPTKAFAATMPNVLNEEAKNYNTSLIPILPVMDSTLNKDGIKITSSSAKSDLYKIFDGDINTGVYSVPRELNVEFDKPTQIDAMTVLGIKGRAANYTVKVEASNDGRLWESLATDKYVTTYYENNIPVFGIDQNKAGAYKHYRFTFSSSWGLDMAEMQFYSKGNAKQPINLTPLMPAMSSLDQDGIKLTASGSTAKDLYKIFDGDAKTSLYSTPGTFIVEFPKATQIDALSMVSAPSRGASYTVSIEGSNDGRLWSSIAQGLKYSPGDNANNQSVLDIPEDRTGSYKFYRFKVQNLWSLDVAEMQFYSKGNPKQQRDMTPVLPVMDSTLNKDGVKITPSSAKSDLYKIFDGDNNTGIYSVPGKLTVEFDNPTQIDAMSVLGMKNRASDYTVKVEASNDGRLWESLATDKYVTTYYENNIPLFEIDQNKAGAYKYYRFNFSSSWGLDMAEMQFYSYGQGSSENSVIIIADEKLDELEAIINDLTTPDKIDNAEASLEEVREIIDSITNPDVKTELEERYEKIVETINEAKATLQVENAENTITQEAVDTANEQIDNLKDGDVKTSLQDRLDYVQDVIDAQNAVNELNESFEEYEEDLVSSDLTSNTEIVDLDNKLNEIKEKHKVVKEKTDVLGNSEKESLNKRISDILDQLETISNTVDTIDQILAEAAEKNYRAANGNAEYRTKAARGTITDLLAMYNEEIETRIGLGNLSWLSINSKLATVDQNGNMKAIKNGIAKITVFNENGYINFYFVVSNSAK